MDLERGFCWAGTDGLDFHVGPDDFLKGSQQDFVQSPKVQIGQNRGWNKGRKNRLKSKLALLAFEDSFCWEGKNVLKVRFGPNDFPQGPQQDFVQTQMVQMGENIFLETNHTRVDKNPFGPDGSWKGWWYTKKYSQKDVQK